MRVLLAYSGGLDTSWLVAWLTREQAAAVTTLTIDCGGFSAADHHDLARRARELGAVEHRVVDARLEMFDRVLRWLIAANVRRGGVYPLCVGAERGLQAEVLARIAREEGYDAVCHGCTAAGNDQVRFEAALATIAPDVDALAPVRDLAVSREEERAYLERHGLPVPRAGGKYSVNAGLWGLTIGGGPLHSSDQPLPDDAWQWTRGGRGERRFAVGFEQGVPVALDGAAAAPIEIVERLNREAGALGIGRGYHLGDTVLGIKGRIAFEAPAAAILLDAHRELEKLVLTEEQRFWKDQMGEVYGRRLHQGLFHDPFQRDLEAFFGSSQQRVTGTALVHALDGRAVVEGVRSPYSLMDASDARYGERASRSQDKSVGRALGRVWAEPARLYNKAGERAARDRHDQEEAR